MGLPSSKTNMPQKAERNPSKVSIWQQEEIWWKKVNVKVERTRG
jgi:hypothetical protein